MKFNQSLSSQIDKMVEEDQKYRIRLANLYNSSNPSEEEIKETIELIEQTDDTNLRAAQEIFEVHGYPGIELVGQKSAENFWLIVQHCDTAVAFQAKVLEALKKEVDNAKIHASYYAYLKDRVLANQGQLQIYGTQVQLNEDQTAYLPKPMMEPDKVDERRKQMGLENIQDYLEQMNEVFHGGLNE